MFLAERSRLGVPEVNTALVCVSLRMETERQIIQNNVVFLLSLVLKMWTKLFFFSVSIFLLTVALPPYSNT